MGRSRLDIARDDFFLEEQGRLTDEERSLIAGMLKGLVGEIVDELLAALPALVAARAEPDRPSVYPRLAAARLIDREGIFRLLLRRADEQRLAGRAPRDATAMAAVMVADEQAAVAEAAMALTIARGHRVDRFHRLGIGFDDLPAEDAVALVHGIAAALRASLDPDCDLPLADAARDLLARHDEGNRVEAAVEGLARALDHVGRATDELIGRVAEERDAALLVALLSRRGGIGFDDGWTMFIGGDVAMLARIAQCSRPATARILAAFEPAMLDGPAERAIERFDSLSEIEVDRRRSWLRLDPHYRDAHSRLGESDG